MSIFNAFYDLIVVIYPLFSNYLIYIFALASIISFVFIVRRLLDV